MRFDIVTIFPDFFQGPLDHGIVRRARERRQIEVHVHDLRQHAHDRHRSVDDAPFGGGGGMVMKAGPLYEAVTSLRGADPPDASPVILLSPQGETIDQRLLRRLAAHPRLILICGRYEGIDERVLQLAHCLEASVGDFVLSGGEIGACMLIEAVTRLIPGVLGCETSSEEDSFTRGLLDYPHYTRPHDIGGMEVPEVIVSGDHEKVRRFRLKHALHATLRKRPDLLAAASLDALCREIMEEIREEIRPRPAST